jgi:putative membrane protein
VVAGAKAQERGNSTEVRQFGLMMVDDHHQANRRLIPIAEVYNVDWPTQLAPSLRKLVDKLKGMSGQEFERTYIDAMVEAHRKDVDSYQKMADKAEGRALKQYIDTTLPILKGHLHRAEQIAQNLEQTQSGE